MSLGERYSVALDGDFHARILAGCSVGFAPGVVFQMDVFRGDANRRRSGLKGSGTADQNKKLGLAGNRGGRNELVHENFWRKQKISCSQGIRKAERLTSEEDPAELEPKHIVVADVVIIVDVDPGHFWSANGGL